MAISNEHLDAAAPTASAQADPGMTLQSEEAKATVAEITAENAALEEASQSAEAQAEATAEQASQMVQVLEEVVEEIQESKAEVGHA